MNIVFVSSASTTSAGGDARVARELAATLSKQNNVLLVLSGKRTSYTRVTDSLSRFEFSGKKKGDVILPSIKPVELTGYYKLLRDFGPDIIHFHDQSPASFVNLLWAVKNKIPTVFTAHTIPSETIYFGLAELFPKSQPLFDNRFFDKYTELFLRRTSGIVAINHSIIDDLENYKNLETPIYEIPNGRNLNKYTCVSFADLKESPKNLLFIGYLTKRKNQSYLIDIMSYLPKDEFKLNLVGVPLKNGYEKVLKKKAVDKNLSVKFLGKVPHEEIPKVLEEAHFFVSASLMEVQSLAILEALASGTPVISLNNETTSEFIDESVGYNFDSSVNPKVFAEKIIELSNFTPDKYEKLCVTGREKVANLDWTNIASQTLSMYEEVLQSKDTSSLGLRAIKKLLKEIDANINVFEQ